MPDAAARPHGIRRAKQARSEETNQRIVDAAIALLEKKRLDEITVADIARKAGVSVGGFYARFESRDALFFSFEHEFFEHLLAEADLVLDPARWVKGHIPEIIEAYVHMAVSAFRRERTMLRQVALRSRGVADPAFRERVNAVNLRLHGAFRALLRVRRDEIPHPNPEAAIDLGLTFVSAAMRETILFPEMCRHLTPLSDEALIRELVRAYASYLGVPIERKTNRRKKT